MGIVDDPDSPDEIGINGAMKYFGDLQVRLDEVACLAVAELLRSPSMGEFTREGFVEGWRGTTESASLKSVHSALVYSQFFLGVIPLRNKPLMRMACANCYWMTQITSDEYIAIPSYCVECKASATLT